MLKPLCSTNSDPAGTQEFANAPLWMFADIPYWLFSLDALWHTSGKAIVNFLCYSSKDVCHE
jgi:hypothetical protein